MRAALFLTAAAAGVVPTEQQVVPTVAPALPGAATPYLEEYAVDGLPGTTTYRLYLELSMQVYNLYTVYGSESAPASFPPAEQLDTPFGTNIGGSNPAFWPMMAAAQYDSWLSVGVDDASAGDALSSIGIDFDGASLEMCVFVPSAASIHTARGSRPGWLAGWAGWAGVQAGLQTVVLTLTTARSSGWNPLKARQRPIFPAAAASLRS